MPNLRGLNKTCLALCQILGDWTKLFCFCLASVPNFRGRKMWPLLAFCVTGNYRNSLERPERWRLRKNESLRMRSMNLFVWRKWMLDGTESSPSLIGLMVFVDVKHHVYLLTDLLTESPVNSHHLVPWRGSGRGQTRSNRQRQATGHHQERHPQTPGQVCFPSCAQLP